MPVYTKIEGEQFESFSEDARLVAVSEKTMFRDLLSVELDAKTLIEMSEAVAADGDTYRLDPELRQQIAKTMEALTDLHASMHSEKLRAAS